MISRLSALRVFSIVVICLCHHVVAGDGQLVLAEGKGFKIFQPFDRLSTSVQSGSGTVLLAPPEVWVKHYSDRAVHLRELVAAQSLVKEVEFGQMAYLETLRQMVLGLNLGSHELTVDTTMNTRKKLRSGGIKESRRNEGLDWPGFAFTMTGVKRIHSVRQLLENAFRNNVEGDIMETGVWRGGMSAFIRGVLRAHNQQSRKSYVCDSFKGLPPSVFSEEKNITWENTPILEISDSEVKSNFEALGLGDPNIVFVKGFFSATMAPLRRLRGNSNDKFALLRLDGDMYESTVDVLYHFYDKLSIGGYLIMDDWYGFESRTACEDFFKVHKINPDIKTVDRLSVYWQKTQEVEIQYWRYEQKVFK